ncbi:MAG: glycosyltransferase family 39 protein [Candidatus Aminicenantes bacterium]|nr:glycosyltransferase family 39 protein [Candidatus Aminicenantes bacterium]
MNFTSKKNTLTGQTPASAFMGSTHFHLFLILLAAAFAYHNLFSIYFLSDDFNLLAGFSAWLTPGVEFFRPVPHLLINFFYKLFGLNLFPYHLLSFLIHYLSAVLIYFIIKRIIGSSYFALTGSVLFAVNFLLSEAVFWLSAITTLLVTFFYLLGIYLYIKSFRLFASGGEGDNKNIEYRTSNIESRSKAQIFVDIEKPLIGSPRRGVEKSPPKTFAYFTALLRTYIPALLCSIMALLSKENAVTFPVVLLLIDLGCNYRPTAQKEIPSPEIEKTKQKFFGGPGGDFSKKPPGRRRQNEKKWLLQSFKRTLPFFLVTAVYLIFKAHSLSAAVAGDALSFGYHNIRNVRHLILSLFTFNPFNDLPFLFIDIKIMNLFLQNPIENLILPVNFKFIASLVGGTFIILACVFLAFRGNRDIKITSWAFIFSMAPFIFTTSHHLPFRGYYIYPLRLYYLPAAFFFIFLAVLLYSGFTWFKKKVKAPKPLMLLMVFLIVSFALTDAVKVNNRSADWITAGNITKSVLTQLGGFLKEGPEDKTIILFNLPDSYRGAYILRNGIRSAIKLLYPDSKVKIEIQRTSPGDFKIPQDRVIKNTIFIDCEEAKLTRFSPPRDSSAK